MAGEIRLPPLPDTGLPPDHVARILVARDQAINRIEAECRSMPRGKPGLPPRVQTRWEMARAEEALAEAIERLRRFNILALDHLNSALNHAVVAWCRTHLRGGTPACYADASQAFAEKADETIKASVQAAKAALSATGAATDEDALAATQAAVGALLEAAAHPPRGRKQYPVRLLPDASKRKPRLRVGSWIDTGRFRPAQVVAVVPGPPLAVQLSYGDEIEEDFRPEGRIWKKVRRPRRLRSLKSVFAPEDWLRHWRNGFARVLEVFDTSLRVDFGQGPVTLFPDAQLSKIEKVDAPDPPDLRPLPERFPPGTWIRQDHFGEAVVLAADDNVLTIMLDDRVVRIAAGPDAKGPVVWRVARPPVDLRTPWESRRHWYWLNDSGRAGHRPCPCCGYPNLGESDEFGIEPMQCPLCGWVDDEESEAGADQVRKDAPNEGYSLTEARTNTLQNGHMFRPGDWRCGLMRMQNPYRELLVEWLNRVREDAPGWHPRDWAVIERVRRRLFQRQNAAIVAPDRVEQPDVLLYRCEAGWINLLIVVSGQGVEIQASHIADPFPDLLAWLEGLVRGDGGRWAVDEECGDTILEFTPQENGKGRLTIIAHGDTAGPAIEAEIEIIPFATTAYREFRRFATDGFDPAQWAGTSVAEELRHGSPPFYPEALDTMDADALLAFARRHFPRPWLEGARLLAMDLAGLCRWVREGLDDSPYGWEGNDLRWLVSGVLEKLL